MQCLWPRTTKHGKVKAYCCVYKDQNGLLRALEALRIVTFQGTAYTCRKECLD